jgi:rhodanese-related sulfurtransferase
MSMFQKRTVPATTVDEAGDLAGVVLLDVREPAEWEAGHAPNAMFRPLGELETVRFELPMNKRVVCVCRSGHRSARATEVLRSWGFDAVNLEGGMQAWAAAGRPVVTDDGSTGRVA